jgi:predicted Holliday junction resolvase-like endonuclease
MASQRLVARTDEEKKKIKEDLSRFLREWKGREWVDKEVRRDAVPILP